MVVKRDAYFRAEEVYRREEREIRLGDSGLWAEVAKRSLLTKAGAKH